MKSFTHLIFPTAISLIVSIIIFYILFEIITPKDNATTNQKIISTTQTLVNPTINNSDINIDSTTKKYSTIEQILFIRKLALLEKCNESIQGFSSDSLLKKENCEKEVENIMLASQQNELLLSKKFATKNDQHKKVNVLNQKDKNNSSIALVNALYNAKPFINLLYLILFMTLWLQLLLCFSLNTKPTETQLALSEWNINSPPIIGVIGTIYSFAYFTLTSSEQTGLFDLFKSNFYDAATTTIIGGTCYVLNLGFSIWISYVVSVKNGMR